MTVRLHPHAAERLEERGALPAEIEATVLGGESFPAKHRPAPGYPHNFAFGGTWRGKVYATKQIEAYAVWEDESWLVITVLVKYF